MKIAAAFLLMIWMTGCSNGKHHTPGAVESESVPEVASNGAVAVESYNELRHKDGGYLGECFVLTDSKTGERFLVVRYCGLAISKISEIKK